MLALCLSTVTLAVDLTDYQWRNRLLFVVAPDASGQEVASVLGELVRSAKELEDRDLLVIQLYLHGQSLIGDRALAPGAAWRLRGEIEVQPDTRLLILAGKDGGIKRRAPLATDLKDIFSQTDAMPMRRYEMHNRQPSAGAGEL